MHLGLKGKEIEMSKAPASNFVFLIDVSGSMSSDDKLGLLKRGLYLLVDQMRDEDKVAIVVYAGSSGLALPSTSGAKKDQIKSVIEQLEAGGSTAGGAGIEHAPSSWRPDSGVGPRIGTERIAHAAIGRSQAPRRADQFPGWADGGVGRRRRACRAS